MVDLSLLPVKPSFDDLNSGRHSAFADDGILFGRPFYCDIVLWSCTRSSSSIDMKFLPHKWEAFVVTAFEVKQQFSKFFLNKDNCSWSDSQYSFMPILLT